MKTIEVVKNGERVIFNEYCIERIETGRMFASDYYYVHVYSRNTRKEFNYLQKDEAVDIVNKIKGRS